jgi:CRP/FNR family transcriptional regulator
MVDDRASGRSHLVQALEDAEGDAPVGVTRRFGKKSFVFLEGQPAASYAIVQSGRVKLVQTQPSGRETILEIVEEGGVLCSGAVWTGDRFCCSAVADSDDTLVRIVPRAVVKNAVSKCPLIAQDLIDDTARRAMAMCRRVGEATSGKVEQRVAALLIRMAENLGMRVDEGVAVTTRLSRQDIADLCGTSVESAIRTMRKLEEDGVVSTDAGTILVRDMEALERLWRGD